MVTFLITTLIIMLTLGLLSYVSSRRSDVRTDQKPGLSLLPGDIKYQSPGGAFTLYFPIMTSIVVSIILSLAFYFLQ
jgi:hypothetical protein